MNVQISGNSFALRTLYSKANVADSSISVDIKLMFVQLLLFCNKDGAGTSNCTQPVLFNMHQVFTVIVCPFTQ